jgi:hypothetical protein
VDPRPQRRGTPALLDRPELNAAVVATNMTIAMSAWMRYRGHRWAATAEMAAAMYLPFIVLLFPLWLDCSPRPDSSSQATY